jgi:hypothetical protein
MHAHRSNRFVTTTGRIRRAFLAEGAGIALATSATGSNVKINEVDVGGRRASPTAN